ncbi:MAG: 16S rRNA (cytidine(1402)-2'-O)-methyltransferase, partial [Patescibacteria group bacterium]
MKITKSKLYVVATPIGNLQDLSERAKEILMGVDLLLCEDTRVTGKLLSVLGSSVSRDSFHQHSTPAKRQAIIDKINSGLSVALVSDAGTPNISDPGGALVADAIKAGIEVIPIPGPSAAITLLSVCGFPADTYTFMGFPPHKKGRQSFFDKIGEVDHTVVIYESKHRIIKTLEQLPDDRLLAVGRELTKLHETIYRG